jgi:hypothetical protein
MDKLNLLLELEHYKLHGLTPSQNYTIDYPFELIQYEISNLKYELLQKNILDFIKSFDIVNDINISNYNILTINNIVATIYNCSNELNYGFVKSDIKKILMKYLFDN